MNIYTYTIIPDVDLNQAKVDACVEMSLATVRHSNDNRAVLKWVTDSGKPAILGVVTEYTHDEILIEMAKPEWQLVV